MLLIVYPLTDNVFLSFHTLTDNVINVSYFD